MSDTPETDAALIGGGHLYVSACDPHIKASLARKLERERDELRARLSEEQQLHSQTLDERDEARELFESSKRARASLSEACDHLQRERDALHAAIRNLRDVQGRYHTQIATERLFALLPEVSSQPEA